MIREFITGKIESLSKIVKRDEQTFRTITLLLPAKTDIENISPEVLEDTLQDAIIDGVMTSDQAEAIRKKANENVETDFIFHELALLENINEKDLVYIIAEPYSGTNIQEMNAAKRVVNQGLYITKDPALFQKAKMNVFREMEKERSNWNK